MRILKSKIGLISLGLFGIILFFVLRHNIPIYQRKFKAFDEAGKGKVVFAQHGEDFIVSTIFDFIGIKEVRYLDIGAWMPWHDSNTYKFYISGSRGVLVEPNDYYVKQIKEARPGDIVLAAGVGFSENESLVDYYLFENASGWNTFSKKIADQHIKAGYKATMQKKPLYNINYIIEKHFKEPPNFISIDVEGLDYDIVKSLNLEKYRPAVLCVETLIVSTKLQDERIIKYLTSKNYEVRGATFANTIFVDKKYIY